jgi:ribosomal protein L32E
MFIIANQWFNYYCEWRSEQPRFNREEFEKDHKSYEIWSRKKGIIEFQTEDGHRAWKIVNV